MTWQVVKTWVMYGTGLRPLMAAIKMARGAPLHLWTARGCTFRARYSRAGVCMYVVVSMEVADDLVKYGTRQLMYGRRPEEQGMSFHKWSQTQTQRSFRT